MKIKDLIEIIEMNKQKYGEDFLNWSIALEQHPDYMDCSNCNEPEDYILDRFNPCDEEDTLYIKSHAMLAHTIWEKSKTLGLQIHY